MNCYIAGVLGTAMVGASVATMTVTDETHNRLQAVLSPELAILYSKIVAERRILYLQGLLLGIVVAYGVLQISGAIKTFHRISLGLAITLLVTVMYYTIMPKSDYMLNHLTSEKENKAWLGVYTTMKQRYFLGFLLGALAAVPFSYAMC